MDDSLSLILIFSFILLTPGKEVDDLIAKLDFVSGLLLIAELLLIDRLFLIIRLFPIATISLCRFDNPKWTESM